MDEDSESEFVIHFVIEALASIQFYLLLAIYSMCCVGVCSYTYALVDDFKMTAENLIPTTMNVAYNNVIVSNRLFELTHLHTEIIR